MIQRRHFIQATTGALATGLLSPLAAQAQALEQVRIINGFPAGGTADATSRRIGDKLAGTAYTRNAAVVENRTGAGGRIAVEAVKSAAADGSTLLLTPYSMMAIYPHIYNKLSYDPFQDFAPVAIATSMVHGLAVGPQVPATVRTVKDYLAWAKANPTLANYGSPAAGSTPHFLGALLGLNSGVELKHIPYRGSIPGIADVVGGQLASMFTPLGDFLANHRAGRLRVIATSGPTRSPFVPEVPTFAEQGFADLVVQEWFGFFAPARTPVATINNANAAIVDALRDRTVTDSLAVQGLLPIASSPEAMARDLRYQFNTWGPIVKRIGFTAES